MKNNIIRIVYLVEGILVNFVEGVKKYKVFCHEKLNMTKAVEYAENMAQVNEGETTVHAAAKYLDAADNECITMLYMVAVCPSKLIPKA